MEKAFFLLAGTVLGWVLNTAKEVWLRSRDERKELAFISAKIGVMLDQLTSECAGIVLNVKNEKAHLDQEGGFNFDKETPTLAFHGLEVDWRVIDAKLAYDLLKLESDLKSYMDSLKDILVDIRADTEDKNLDVDRLREALGEERVYRLSLIGRESYRLSKEVKSLSGVTVPDKELEQCLEILESYPWKPG